MAIDSLKKYKHIIIKLKQILTWEEYVSTLFFIKAQKKILIARGEEETRYENIKINNEMLTIILSYNTKILIKIKGGGTGDKIDNLISANKKIYKVLFELTNFKIDIFEEKMPEKFSRLKSKNRKKLLNLIEENIFLFKDTNIDDLKALDLYLKENKPNAIGYFNKINEEINIFLRDKNL